MEKLTAQLTITLFQAEEVRGEGGGGFTFILQQSDETHHQQCD